MDQPSILQAKPYKNSLRINLCVLCVCAKPPRGIVVNLYCISFCSFGGFFPHIRQSEMCKMHAADTREQSAALAPFQRYQPSQPPVKIVNSAALRERFAGHFSGSIAKTANFANRVQYI